MTSVPITDALTFALMLQRQEGSFTYGNPYESASRHRICRRCVSYPGDTLGAAWDAWVGTGLVLAWEDYKLGRCPICEKIQP